MCFTFENRYCLPSYDSQVGGYFNCASPSDNSCNECAPCIVPCAVIHAPADLCVSLVSLYKCCEGPVQSRKDCLKNLISTISSIVQIPFIMCYMVNPRVDRLSLFYKKDDFTLKTQINDCYDDDDQLLFLKQLKRNPKFRDRFVQVECSPISPLVSAIEGRKWKIAKGLLKDHEGHRHENNQHGYCHAWNAVKKLTTALDGYIENSRAVFAGILGDVQVKNFIGNIPKKFETIQQSGSSLKQEVDKEQQESVSLIINKESDNLDDFNISNAVNTTFRDDVTQMDSIYFVYPDRPSNFLLFDCSLLSFCALNLQFKNIKLLLKNGIDVNALNKASITALENIFLNYKIKDELDIPNPDEEGIIHYEFEKNHTGIVEMAKLLISNGALFYGQDLEDANLLKYVESREEVSKREEESKMALSDEDDSVSQNRYFRCFPRSPVSIEKLRFWRTHVKELRTASQQGVNIYYKVIVSSLDSRFPTALSNLIVQYVHPG